MNDITAAMHADVPSHDSEDHNRSANPSLNDIIDARLSRRGMLRVGMGSAGAAVLGSLAACGGGETLGEAQAVTTKAALALNFTPVPKSLADKVLVPAGYTATAIYATGDPLTAATPEYRNDGTDTDFDQRAGDQHDGMEYFGLNATGTARDANGSKRGLLVMNHEALVDQFLHAAGVSPRPRPAAETDKEIPAHGVSIVEVQRKANAYSYDPSSPYNRRVTPNTPMQLNGPVRASSLAATQYSPNGTACRGTINNCGTGLTPWGTYLSGEENWAGYFTRSATDNAARALVDAKSVASLNRYGRAQGAASRHGWETSGADDVYARWDLSVRGASATDDYRNELNTFGYMVEIDPYDKNVALRKRTALGRFAHESASFGPRVVDQPLVVYMGDDSIGEYMYKFVSTALWRAADAEPANRITTGDRYLDDGKLYVAKFDADGTGRWIEVTIADAAIAGYAGYAFADQADVLVNVRLAADALGATKMDRPEWCAVNQANGEVYYTLTNNSSRKVSPTSAQQGLDAANPRSYTDAPTAAAASAARNVNGHIIRMREDGALGAATAFAWDIYLFGAQADADLAKVNLSALNDDQDFSSPDGLWFSPKTGLCFIQTDDGAFTDQTNCMMLIGKPGRVGDGQAVTLDYTKADGTPLPITTYVGAKPTADTLARFLVGPVDCEVTGVTETPDGKTLFVNIQHPGENISKANVGDPSKYTSHWPGNTGYGAGGATARPRSATIVITRDDGALIGGNGSVVLNLR
ncbi:MAG TPA: PhoX family phosphatase [Ramlibacter sp.]|nr:PhoX family phosphatase [Ramlibacter sp.]